MSTQVPIFFTLVILTLTITQPVIAQNVVKFELQREQKITTTLGVNNTCANSHIFDLSENPEASWVKIIGPRTATIASRNTQAFSVELSSVGLDAGTHLVELPVTCRDCASEPRCGPSRFSFPLQIKVLFSNEEVESWKEGDYVPGEILVTLRGRSQDIDRTVRDLSRRYGLNRRAMVRLSSTPEVLVLFRVVNPGESLPNLVRQIQLGSDVYSVRPNLIYKGSGVSKRNYESLQYGPQLIRADLVYRYATGKGVRIALIDTGIDDNDDLKGRVIEKKNFTDDKGPRRNFHGTIMAGIISAISHNGFGINGVAPEARVLSIKVLNQQSAESQPIGTSFTLVKGLDFAIQKRVQIANMSLGTIHYDGNVANMVRTAVKLGIVVIAASGNGGPQGRPYYPAALSEVIAVSAIGHDRKAYASGSAGNYIDLAAPGVGILSTWPGNTFHNSEGSSEAAAHVTGVVALLMEKKPKISPVEIRTLLENTAADLGPKGRDEVFGSGLVDACKSLEVVTGNGKICP
jgi:Subtilase family